MAVSDSVFLNIVSVWMWSAYIAGITLGDFCLIRSVIPLVESVKRTGPSMEPWETRLVTGLESERVLSSNSDNKSPACWITLKPRVTHSKCIFQAIKQPVVEGHRQIPYLTLVGREVRLPDCLFH